MYLFDGSADSQLSQAAQWQDSAITSAGKSSLEVVAHRDAVLRAARANQKGASTENI